MKTIEEKAKRYDEIVDKVLHKYKSIERALSHIEVKNILQDLVPELAESEDEKIRKGLIEFVQEYGDKFYSQVAKSSAIAYLEKQGEQKPEWSEEDEKKKEFLISLVNEWCDKAHNATSMIREEISDWLKSLKDRCLPQQKSEWSEKDEEMLKEAKNQIAYALCEQDGDYSEEEPVFFWLKSLKERCLPQPKQEWSEEDGAMIITIINRLELGKTNTQEIPYIDKCISWLKSIRPQPKQEWSEEEKLHLMGYDRGFVAKTKNNNEQEWSEEDEENLKECIASIWNQEDFDYNKKDLLESFLKSLRPQKQWKPSKEQLEALIDATQTYYACKEKELLLDLYEQLKSL